MPNKVSFNVLFMHSKMKSLIKNINTICLSYWYQSVYA